VEQTTLPPCPLCGGTRVLCDFGMTPKVLFRRLTASGGRTSTAKAYVCLNCGHATLYASDPQNLKLPKEK
jgi:predicted RNA-binding Zn-ribbon protein involved in translation (DUF1610 family)